MRERQLGTVTAEFAPGRDNPRNSEGDFIQLADGKILFIYSRYKGESQSDHATADLCMVSSTDDAKTFGGECVLFRCEEEGAINIMSVTLRHLQNGDIGLFYLVRKTRTLLQMYLRRSADGGETWSERVLCTPQEGFFVVNNDRVLCLSNGRILIPAAFHRTGTDFFDERSEVVFFYSDDDGRSFQEAEGKVALTCGGVHKSGLQEPGVVEISPGVLRGWARTDLGRQYEFFSLDDGNTWTQAQPSQFTSPKSPLSMKRFDAKTLVAIWNPIPQYNGREECKDAFLGGRSPFVIAVSRDNGEHFGEPVAFETDEESGYCYCAISFTETAMLLAYCAGSLADGSCLARTRIRRVPLSELWEIL